MSGRRSAIKLRQLEYFLAAARTCNFSKAAELVAISQPALSQQIAELEAELGYALFLRKGRSVSLTEAGEVYRAHAHRSITAINDGRSALADLSGLQRGHLRIGVSQSFVHKILPPILGEFITAYPNITFSVIELTAAQIENQLMEGVLDVGIAFAPSVLPDTELEPILEERLVLVTGIDHPLAARKSLPLAELDGKRVVLLTSDFSTRQLLNQYFREARAIPRVIGETNSIGVMRGISGNSDVLSIIPEGAIGIDHDLVTVPLVDPTPVRVSALLWSHRGYRSHAANAFADLVRMRFPTLLRLSDRAQLT